MKGIRCLLLVLICLVVACAVDERAPSAKLGSQASALLAGSFDVAVRLPVATPLTQLGVGALRELRIEEGAEIEGPAVASEGGVLVDPGARVGSVVATGDVAIGERARVDGGIHAAGEIRVARHARIAGALEPRAPTPTTLVHWSVSTGESQGDVVVEPKQLRNLYPGTFGALRAECGARLTLHTGVYVFEELDLGTGTELVVDGAAGPVQIYVRQHLALDAKVTSADASEPSLFVGYLGTDSLHVGPSFSGMLVAPTAAVTLDSCESCRRRRSEHGTGHGRSGLWSTLASRFRRGGSDHDGRRDDDDDAREEDGNRHGGHDGHGGHDSGGECGAILGVFFAESLSIERGVRVQHRSFDWGAVAGPAVVSSVDTASLPRHTMLESPVDFWVGASSGGAAAGAGGSSTSPGGGAGGGSGSSAISRSYDTARDVSFTLRDEYEVAGGVLGNGTVDFSFGTVAGSQVTCSYVGRAPTATPTTPQDLNLGRMLRFVSCSDGRPFNAIRTANHFELTVRPVPGYPVSVRPPVTDAGGCSDELPILTPTQTRELRAGFDWKAQRKVAEKNPDGSYAVYYAWIYIRNKEQALALRKLFIHVLKRPLLNEELQVHAGRCGTFTNPGDGEGMFVPALVPGATYNKLIDALTSREVSGERVVFEAIRIRGLPPAERFPNGALRTDLLAQSGFRYLDYETKPLPGTDEILLDAGAARALTDVLSWVAQTARNVSEVVTNTFGAIARLLSGTVGITLHLHAITRDAAFQSAADPNPIMLRAWGDWHGLPLGALGMETTLVQRVEYLPFAVTSQGHTDRTGKVFVNAARGAGVDGSGMCIEARTEAAFVTDFLIANTVCDLRGFDPKLTSKVAEYTLGNFDQSREIEVRFYNPRLTALYQSDDVWLWSVDVAQYRPRRARILSGYFADTFSQNTESGLKKPYTPCLGYSPMLPDALATAAYGTISAVLPAGAPAFAIAGTVFAAVVGSSDIVISTGSKIGQNRVVGSHEYGHFLFCSLLNDFSGALDDPAGNLIRDTIANSGLDSPVRYINEGVADFFAGQVVGAADYGWATGVRGMAAYGSQSGTFCALPGECFDANLSGSPSNSQEPAGVGRIVTLLQDVFDGASMRYANSPGESDWWQFLATGSPLVASSTGHAVHDANLERVALRGNALMSVAKHLSSQESVGDLEFYSALNGAMVDSGVSWCDRCRVFALHSGRTPQIPAVADLFDSCLRDGLVAQTVGVPPVPDLRLDAASCVPCPDGYTSNRDGVCIPCPAPGRVVANECIRCTPDVVRDGATLVTEILNVDYSAPGDTCPDTFSLEITRPGLAFERPVLSLSVDLGPIGFPEQVECTGVFGLDFYESRGSGLEHSVVSGRGRWQPCDMCFQSCFDLPVGKSLVGTELTGVATLRAETARVVRRQMSVSVLGPEGPLR